MIVNIIDLEHKFFEMAHYKDINSMVVAKIIHHNKLIDILVTCDYKGVAHFFLIR
jgi:hypothetical protein